jgi:hypothetical protein
MNFKHTDNIQGTHLQGYVNTTYADLVKLFGQPTFTDGDKTNSEWGLKFEDGTVATIYDYKMPMTPVDEYEWHIGGLSKKAVHRVCAALGTVPTRYCY